MVMTSLHYVVFHCSEAHYQGFIQWGGGGGGGGEANKERGKEGEPERERTFDIRRK